MQKTILILGVALSALLSGCQPPCSAANCATGCCDSAGICQLGIAYGACGIGGAKCSVCTGPQRCEQGACFTPGTTGGGSGGGGAAGGGTATGGGSGATGGGTGGTGGGTSGPSLDVMPLGDSTEPVIINFGQRLKLIARANGLSSPAVTFSVIDISPAGSLFRTGPQTADFVANSPSTSAMTQIQVTADAMSSLATTITLLHNGTRKIQVTPSEYSFFSTQPYNVNPNTRQSFGVLDTTVPGALRGVANVDWFLWTNESLNTTDKPVNGLAVLKNAGTARIYARDPDSKQWTSADVIVETTTQPSIEVTPAVSTVNVGGTVQFTAFVSNGEPVTWTVTGTGAGTISSTGTYTAPNVAGIYIVQAKPAGADGSHFGVATVVVQ